MGARGHVRFAFWNRDLRDCESGFSGLPLHVLDGIGVPCWTFTGSRSIIGANRDLAVLVRSRARLVAWRRIGGGAHRVAGAYAGSAAHRWRGLVLRGALRGESPRTREGRRPDRPERQGQGIRGQGIVGNPCFCVAWDWGIGGGGDADAPGLVVDGRRLVVADAGVDHYVDDVHDEECDDGQD